MAAEVSRDWSELLPELIERIAGTLGDITDYVMFGLVCKSWRSAARSISFRQQSPWLFSICDDYECRLRLYNPRQTSTPKIYIFPLPKDAYGLYKIYGATYGYFLVHQPHIGRLSLFNPLLPKGSSSWLTLPQLPKNWFGGFITIYKPQLFKFGDGSYCVTFFDEFRFDLFCWRLGDPSFTELYNISVNPEYKFKVMEYTLYKGNFYLIGETYIADAGYDYIRQMVIVDASKFTVTSRFLIPNVYKNFDLSLVESSSQELLMVAYTKVGWHFQQCQVIRVDLSHQPPTFVKVNSIGDDALFMTKMSGFVYFFTTKSKGLKRNCIYYIDGPCSSGCFSVNIGNGSTVREFLHNGEKNVGWLTPSLSSIVE